MTTIETTIYETANGRIEMQRTVYNTYKVTATVGGETIRFQVCISDLWTFPRETGETFEKHFKRYIIYRVAKAVPQKYHDTQEPQP